MLNNSNFTCGINELNNNEGIGSPHTACRNAPRCHSYSNNKQFTHADAMLLHKINEIVSTRSA